ncbi:MAG: ankyrin repeat domain-containing protein [Pirellulaceae bacterium]
MLSAIKFTSESLEASHIASKRFDFVHGRSFQATRMLGGETLFRSWLHFAAKKCCWEIVDYLIDKGLLINQHGGLSDSLPIEQAAAGGHPEVVALLIQKGSQLDTDVSTRNPLFAAIYAGSIEAVELLLKAGINHRVKYSGDKA